MVIIVNVNDLPIDSNFLFPKKDTTLVLENVVMPYIQDKPPISFFLNSSHRLK